MTRILVIEDNRDLAAGLRNNLEIEGYEVEVALNGAAARAALKSGSADLVILDLMLPDTDGFRILRELRAEDPEVPVLILTARGEEADKVRGLRLGADDYVTKPFGLLELLARVDALLRRAQPAEARPAESESFGHLEIRRPARQVLKDGEIVALTPKEYDLLLALVDRRGAVASRSQLMRQVWAYSDTVVNRTVDTHVAELRKKLERVPSRPELIVTVRSVGYRWDADGGSRSTNGR